MAECWHRLGEPARWVIREYGAGVGGLAYDILAGLSEEAPEALAGLEYRLIEPNRHRLAEALRAMAEVGLADIVRAEEPAAAGGQLDPILGVALANEVADAFPVHRLLIRDGRPREEGVGWRDGGLVALEREPTPAGAAALATLEREGVRLVEGARYDLSPAAALWFGELCRSIRRGYAMTIDYGYPAPVLYSGHRLEGTVRAYHAHAVTDDPLRRVGEQDLTAHVDFTALQRAAEAAGGRLAGCTTQGAMLASLGLGDRLLALQRDSDATLADYTSAQAVVLRLIDPGGLGRFGVLIVAMDAPVDPPLAAFLTPAPTF
jgi:SAM-dependent MidA family methyltransferase